MIPAFFLPYQRSIALHLLASSCLSSLFICFWASMSDICIGGLVREGKVRENKIFAYVYHTEGPMLPLYNLIVIAEGATDTKKKEAGKPGLLINNISYLITSSLCCITLRQASLTKIHAQDTSHVLLKPPARMATHKSVGWDVFNAGPADISYLGMTSCLYLVEIWSIH